MKILTVYILLLFLFFLPSCSDISETVKFSPESQTAPGEDLSTLYPTIQKAYPGTLQTLDIPQEYPTDVIPEGAVCAVLYTDIMENDNGEMGSAFALFENGTQIGHRINETSSSKLFTIEPASGTFDYGNTYELYVYGFAHLNDDTSLYTDFEPLVESPATTLSPVNPEYVVFTFRTSLEYSEDNQAPFFLGATPGPGDTDVDDMLGDPAGTNSYIEFTLYDDRNPMILPDSVTSASVELYEIGSGIVSCSVIFVNTDLNFKTYRIQPDAAFLPLTNSATYRVTLSKSNAIEDIAGNRMEEFTYYFLVEP